MKLRKTLAGILGAVVMLLGVGTFEHVNRETGVHAAEEWVLVKNASDLAVGDKIVIAARDSNFALSTTQNSNNRGQASITRNGDNITLSSGVQVIDVEEGSSTDTLSFKTSAGYLYCASTSSKNYLRTQSAKNDAASWNITIDTADGTATVKSQISNISRNLLSYNQSSSIFACYSSVQKDIVIYEQIITSEAECEHDYIIPTDDKVVEITAPTCFEYGTYAKVCSKCGQAAGQEEHYYQGTELKDHEFNSNTGICKNCDALKDGVLATLRYYLNKYYNDNQYLKDTTIYTNSEADNDAEIYFHAAASVKNRETWYFGDEDNGTTKLVMNTHEDLKDDEIDGEVDVTSTYENLNNKVWHTGKNGDWWVDWTSVEDKFVTLKDFIDSSDENWTYSNGTFTYNLKETTHNEDTNVVTEHEMTRMARSFVAPMWQDPNSQNFNYARFSKLTIKEDSNNQLVMKLFVEDDNVGILVEDKQSERLFAQATINSVYNVEINIEGNGTVVEENRLIAGNHTAEYTLNIPEGYRVSSATATKATISTTTEGFALSKATGNVVVTIVVEEKTNDPITETLSFTTTASRQSLTTTQQVWVNGGITFINNKANSTNNVADYSNPIRMYKNSEIIIEANQMTKIVINSNGSIDYKTALVNSLNDANIAYTNNGNLYTIVFGEAVNSFNLTLSGGQVRLVSIEVTYIAE